MKLRLDRRIVFATLSSAAFALAASCTATKSSTFDADDDGGSSGPTTTSSGDGSDAGQGGNDSGAATGAGGINFTVGAAQGGSTSGGTVCDALPDEDKDMDGYSINQGDCNDCDANVSPGAIEVPTDPMDPKAEPADENCDGNIDEALMPCDQMIQLGDIDPKNAAKAIGLCNDVQNGAEFGVKSALYVRANGTPANPGISAGVLPNFGPNVAAREGSAMLVMSSGHARLPSQNGACGSFSCQTSGMGTPPPGFPQNVPSCPTETDINDDIALEVQLKAPTNATGYSFEFDFYSFEYPEFVCTSFNDQFIALVQPPPMGSVNGNISFDSMNNPVSVNIAFFDVCLGCPLGETELQGTGFDVWDDAGATSWLTTKAPIKGGEEFSIRFAIWDTGDQSWDSTVLVDNFQWLANAGTVVVGTVPTPN